MCLTMMMCAQNGEIFLRMVMSFGPGFDMVDDYRFRFPTDATQKTIPE